MSEKEQNIGTKKLSWLKMESVKIAFGLVLLLFSFYITLSVVSYFFTGGADQSLLEHLDLTTSDEIKVQIRNWTGYRGAALAEFLIAKSFGVSSLFLVYFIARLGLKLMGFLRVKAFSLLCTCIFFTLWGSFLFSFLGAENSFFNFGGQCGKSEVTWVEAQIGAPGAFFLLLFTIIIYFYVFKGVSFLQMKENVLNFIEKVKNKTKLEPKPIVENNEQESVVAENNANEGETTKTEVVDETVAESVATPALDDVMQKESTVEVKPSVVTTIQEEQQPEKDSDSNNQKTEEVASVTTKETETESENSDQEVQFVINPVQNDDVAASIPEDDTRTAETEDNDADMVYQELMDRLGPYDPTAELPDFKMPTLDLLTDYPIGQVLDEEEQLGNKNRITQVLKNFGIDITSVSATVGPTITLYEIVPAPGVRISKIQGLEKDIALSLAAKGIRIIAPIPGKGTIGIEVPNKNPQIVSMRSVLGSQAFQDSKFELPVAFGRTITNEVFMVDLAKTPHLLVAGATGMGKSVGLNVLLTSLLYKKHPATMKLVMVDPKQVEFSIYEKIEKHYLAKLPGEGSAIITDTTKVVQTLTSLTTEMENRYTLLADVHLRTIKEYNAKFISRKINPAKELPNGLCHHYLPYIVVIIDEYGDLLMTAGKEIETPIARIAQKARAVGIHMVIATQRPSVKIVTGIIKANFPARLAFRVASRIDSQTILDAPGAQELVGKGDMLYSTGGADNTRVQCAFVDTPEVEDMNNFIGEQHGYPEAYRLPEFIDENGDVVGSVVVDTKSLDPRLREAAELVVNAQNGSTSSIQRTLEVGFNRAGRIMDQLEAIGVVGPVRGSKPRDVLVQYIDDLDIIFSNLK